MTEPAHASGSRSADIPFVLHDSVPQMLTCRQLIIVTTKSWNDANATVQLLEILSEPGIYSRVRTL
jgi:hypothetical protein